MHQADACAPLDLWAPIAEDYIDPCEPSFDENKRLSPRRCKYLSENGVR